MTNVKLAQIMDSLGFFGEADNMERIAVKRGPGIYWGVPREPHLHERLKNLLGICTAMQGVLNSDTASPQIKKWAKAKLDEHAPHLKKAAPYLLKIDECRPYLEKLSTMPGFEFLKIQEPKFEDRQQVMDFDDNNDINILEMQE